MSGELAFSEAVNESYTKKNENEIKSSLKNYRWARPHLEKLAKKYRGSKTPRELISEFNTILSDIPYLQTPAENTGLAASILLDRTDYQKVMQKTDIVRFKQRLHNLFGKLSDELTYTVIGRFFGLMTPRQLFEKCRQLAVDLGYPPASASCVYALEIILGRISKVNILSELRRRENKRIISYLAEKFTLSKSDAELLLDNYCSVTSDSCFDEKFKGIFDSLDKYPNSDERNTFLTIQVLLDKITTCKAGVLSKINRNMHFLDEYKNKFSLSKHDVFKLKLKYCNGNSKNRLDKDASGVMKNFHGPLNFDTVTPIALKVLTDDISLETAKFLAEFAMAFDQFAISKKDLAKITDKYAGLRNPWELAEVFRSVIDSLCCVESREENYAAAVEVLLEGTSNAFKRAVMQSQVQKEKFLFNKGVSELSWAQGYITEITDKFFPAKSIDEVKTEFELILHKLAGENDMTLSYDIALNALLGKISLKEAQSKALSRKMLNSFDWAKGFVKEIESSYLGVKEITDITRKLDHRFNRFTFWKYNRPAHRFVIDKIIRELNGEISSKITFLAMVFLEREMPLESAGKICKHLEAKNPADIDLSETCGKYFKIYSYLDDHNQTALEIIRHF
jgi:hypothetical protein